MIENTLNTLIEAVNKNTAALLAGKAAGGTSAASAAATTTTASKPAAAAATKPKGPTFEEVKAAVVKVKDARGKPAAHKIIRDIGQAPELAAMKPEYFAAVLSACEAALAGGEEEEDNDTL